MRIAIIVGLALMLVITGCTTALHTLSLGSINEREPDMKALDRRVRGLMATWYVLKDEGAFWRFFSTRSPYGPKADPVLFTSAFDGRPEDAQPAFVSISDGDIEYELDGDPGIEYLNPENDLFAILKYDVTITTNDPQFHMHYPEEEKLFASIPDEPYWLVVYEIEGGGYSNATVAMIWIHENGTWKLWALAHFS